MTVVEGPWVTNILLTFNTERKPFDDVRVRRRSPSPSIAGAARRRWAR